MRWTSCSNDQRYSYYFILCPHAYIYDVARVSPYIVHQLTIHFVTDPSCCVFIPSLTRVNCRTASLYYCNKKRSILVQLWFKISMLCIPLRGCFAANFLNNGLSISAIAFSNVFHEGSPNRSVLYSFCLIQSLRASLSELNGSLEFLSVIVSMSERLIPRYILSCFHFPARLLHSQTTVFQSSSSAKQQKDVTYTVRQDDAYSS